MNSIGRIGPTTALIVAPVLAVPAIRRRGADASAADQVLDDVPYTVLASPPAPSTALLHRMRSAHAEGQLLPALMPRAARQAGRLSSAELAALHAYTPYQEYRGLNLDVWV